MGTYPDGRRFAFTILDDTDDSTLENARPVYDCLRDHGLRTTKTVWAHDSPRGSRHFYAADTLDRADYLAWVHELAAAGFEIASHGASMESSFRDETIGGLELFEREFGAKPRLYANHAFNQENVYWGSRRFDTAWVRAVLGALRSEDDFEGEVEGSDYFWGDLCREHVEYVRNLTFSELDMLQANPEMPYARDTTPFVRLWFSTTDAPDADCFAERITVEALERLEEEGGVCIVSTHLGKGYARDGRVRPEFEAVVRHLAERPGWYVPTSTILDHLRERGAGGVLGASARRRLELRYLVDQVMMKLGRR